MNDANQPYSRNHPFIASVKKRYPLCKTGSKKNTQHVVIDLKGSGITYDVGDCIGIYPINDPELVNKTLDALNKTGQEKVEFQDQSLTLREFLTKKGNITQFSRKFLSEIASRQPDPIKKGRIEELLSEGHKEACKLYLNTHEVWDVLSENAEVAWETHEFCQLMMPLLPRLYSIASDQSYVGDEAHLTVANLLYETNQQLRRGVCTHYLCDLAPIGEWSVPVYPHANHGFTLPADPNASLIMIGPGTGIAPYRGFLQSRTAHESPGRNWLFFGEWNRETDFFYEEEWLDMQMKIPFKIETAFSRDQEHKVYVQHRMLDHGAELYNWIEQGAYIYVCGDATHMAKDVDAVLNEILQLHGGKTQEESKHYLKFLKQEKRYLRDVY